MLVKSKPLVKSKAYSKIRAPVSADLAAVDLTEERDDRRWNHPKPESHEQTNGWSVMMFLSDIIAL